MYNISLLKSISEDPISAIEYNNKHIINCITMELLENKNWSKEEIEQAKLIIQISNCLYNNTDSVVLPLDDGVYDLLLEATRKYAPDIQSGALPQNLGSVNKVFAPSDNCKQVMYHVSDDDIEKRNNMLFPSILDIQRTYKHNDIFPTQLLDQNDYITKRQRNTSHEHPELVGTLHKCKFVLNKDAQDKNAFKDSNVKIVERDWIVPCLYNLFQPTDILDMILSLKYDGVSIEADVNTEIVSARTRGDTDLSVASDLTPIFKGYKFPNAIDLGETIGMKFEAIVTYENLCIINRLKGYEYANGRTAIIGILGGSDAYRYRDLITLVPLQTTLKDDDGKPLDRMVEIEFMNKYYTRDVMFKYQVISGNYSSLLFQIKRYAEEAEFARSFMNFMYDGIVVEFYDPEIREALGRKNSIDQYKMAVKFNPLKRKSVFTGFKYTVGQTGVITPMIYFDPVEFLGAIHDHTTGYSYEHFNELDLNIGDVIDIDYNHDVMPYVSKPDIEFNRRNHMRAKLPEELFPTNCPFCGSKIVISPTNKSAYCRNPSCPGKEAKKISNMIAKLGIKDIGEERINTLKVKSLRELYSYPMEKMAELIGPTNAAKFKSQLDFIRNTPTPDYVLIGSLGFTGISAKTWKLIFERMLLGDIVKYLDNGYTQDVADMFNTIKGIGKATAETVVEEYPSFKDDIRFILDNFSIVDSYGNITVKKKIRFTGFRDSELVETLNSMGYDADDNAGVTKDTYILLVPYNGYNMGNKFQKATKYGVRIMPVNEFKEQFNLNR